LPQHRVALAADGGPTAPVAPTFAGLDLYDWDPATLEATPVSSWTDSGQGIELTQSGTARPAWLAAGGAQALNFPVVHYDGVDDFLESAGGLNLDWSGGVSVFLVKERISIAFNEGPLLLRSDGDTRQQGNLEIYSTSSSDAYCYSNRFGGTGGYYRALDAGMNTTDPVLWSVRMIASLGTAGSPDPFRQNEADYTVTKVGTPQGPTTDVDIIELGHGFNGGKWHAYCYRQMFYAGRDMTEAEEVEVIDYLNTKYGVY
jgi:hypothetical protein